MLTRPARIRRDAGFTLIELLISISILGVIVTALVGLMFASLTANRQTSNQLDGTRAEQFSAVYFAPDVQGATDIQTNVTARCGSGTALLELRGTSYDPDPGSLADRVVVVDYVFGTATVDGVLTGRLERRYCESPTALYPLTPTRTQTVARTLSAVPPVPVCTPAPCGPTSTAVTLPMSRLGTDPGFTLLGTRRAS